MAFNGNMLRLARQVRKVSQEGLVESLRGKLTQGTLSKIEHGRVQPDDEVVAALASALRFQPSFFTDAAYLRQPPVSYHRMRTKLLTSDRDAIHGKSEVIRLALAKCLASAEPERPAIPLPSFDLDQFSGDPKEAARATRAALNVPRGPIQSLTSIAERAGVVICPFDFGSALIDGFCQQSDGQLPPLVFINTPMAIDRYRYSLAHEIGHLVCHAVPNAQQEIQANQFASEFLMPSDEIYDDLRDFSLAKAMELKLYWGTSMQALTYKAWELGRIGDQKKQNCFIEMSRRGWRKTEPIEVRNFHERPAVLRALIDVHIRELGYSVPELAEMFGLLPSEVRAFLPIEETRPKLRLVSSRDVS